MIPPIRLFSKLMELLEQLDRRLAFHSAHQIRNGHFRRNHNNYVNMILLHVKFHNFATRIATNGLDTGACCFYDRLNKYPVPILRDPYNVILAVSYCVETGDSGERPHGQAHLGPA